MKPEPRSANPTLSPEPPVIEKFSFRADLEEEARTQLSCMVTDGDLPFTINWLKDGRHLQHDPDVESKQTSDFSTVSGKQGNRKRKEVERNETTKVLRLFRSID